MTRIIVGHTNPLIMRVWDCAIAIRIMAHRQCGRPNPIRCLTNNSAHRTGDMGDGLKGFHNRDIIGRMHNRTKAVTDEIQHMNRRAFAIQFREKTDHPTPPDAARKSQGSGLVNAF